MKKTLLTAFVLSTAVNAQTIECPKHFPTKVMPLSDTPSAHNVGARILPAPLSFATIQFSDLYGQPIEPPPGDRKVKGGWDTEYRFMPEEKTKWLVCVYGGTEWSGLKRINWGAVEWWGKVDEKSTSCVLKVRAQKEQYMPAFYTATAVCK